MKNNRMLRAVRLEQVDHPPLWLMRQAGRYLPEYHQLKEKAGGFLGLCRIPEYAIEATLQPLRRFDFDAAILFSDILIPAAAMGIALDFSPGPIIGNPVRSLSDVNALKIPDPSKSLSFVTETLRGLKSELPDSKALIGFAGAPFTVASYMVEDGRSRREFETVRKMFYERRDILDALLDKVIKTTVLYLDAQINAGADIIQIFDSSAGRLPPRVFEQTALASAKKVIDSLGQKRVPIIYFAPGAMLCLDAMKGIGADIIGVDFRIGIDRARKILTDDIAVQGNLDPAALLGSRESVIEQVRAVLQENRGRPGHIFNLGHGVLPGTPIENVEALVETVREKAC